MFTAADRHYAEIQSVRERGAKLTSPIRVTDFGYTGSPRTDISCTLIFAPILPLLLFFVTYYFMIRCLSAVAVLIHRFLLCKINFYFYLTHHWTVLGYAVVAFRLP